MDSILNIKNLCFKYDICKEYFLKNINLKLNRGDRVALIGSNGSGKSTLLRCISGHHIINFDRFEIEGTNYNNIPWCDQHNGLAYLGGSWVREKGFIGIQPYFQDIEARSMMKDWQKKYKSRRDELVNVLSIDLSWNMNKVSDGQRQKVRIMLKLMKPFKCCVIDEFATTLDLLSRQRLAEYLVKETTNRDACLIYATHLFDNPMFYWCNKVCFLKSGKLSIPKNISKLNDSLHNITIKLIESQPLYKMNNNIRSTEDSGYESGRSKLVT